MFLVDLTGFLIGLILLLMLIVSVTIFAVAMWKEYQGEYFSVRELIDDTVKVLKTFWSAVRNLLTKIGARITGAKKKTGARKPGAQKTKMIEASTEDNGRPKVYRAKELLTKEELSNFRTAKRWADRYGHLVFTKVRLSDLIQSNVDPQVDKKPQVIIQSKCVDFVICDQTMKVKCVILINTNVSKRSMEIHRFISNALTSCGYSVLMTERIAEKDLEIACK